MNKNVEKANGKLFYAHVGEFKGVGEEKLILHEVSLDSNIGKEFSYGAGNTLIVDPSAVVRFDKEEKQEELPF